MRVKKEGLQKKQCQLGQRRPKTRMRGSTKSFHAEHHVEQHRLLETRDRRSGKTDTRSLSLLVLSFDGTH